MERSKLVAGFTENDLRQAGYREFPPTSNNLGQTALWQKRLPNREGIPTLYLNISFYHYPTIEGDRMVEADFQCERRREPLTVTIHMFVGANTTIGDLEDFAMEAFKKLDFIRK